MAAAARPTLCSFLSTARAALAGRAAPLTFVVGNESADLDSICSAVLLAYIRTHQPPAPARPSLHIPLANIPRADFALRPEIAGALGRVGLSTDDVPALDDVLTPAPPPASRWLLVDHNALTGPLRGAVPASAVVGCIDHHIDERVVPPDCGPAEPRIVRVAGSCSTLVAEYARAAWDAAAAAAPAEADAQLASLALAAVLLDTSNFRDRFKSTKLDVDAVAYLERRLAAAAAAAGPDAAGDYDRAGFFEHLHALERDLGRLSVRDILRKDYKQWEHDGACRIGVSVVVQPLRYVIGRASGRDPESEPPEPSPFLGAVRSWGRERDLDLVVVMTAAAAPGGQFRKELLAWGLTERGISAAREFERRNADPLRLGAWEDGVLDLVDRGGSGGSGHGHDDDGDASDGWRRAWVQGNLSHSRKQIAPLLREAARVAAGAAAQKEEHANTALP